MRVSARSSPGAEGSVFHLELVSNGLDAHGDTRGDNREVYPETVT